MLWSKKIQEQKKHNVICMYQSGKGDKAISNSFRNWIWIELKTVLQRSVSQNSTTAYGKCLIAVSATKGDISSLGVNYFYIEQGRFGHLFPFRNKAICIYLAYLDVRLTFVWSESLCDKLNPMPFCWSICGMWKPSSTYTSIHVSALRSSSL